MLRTGAADLVALNVITSPNESVIVPVAVSPARLTVIAIAPAPNGAVSLTAPFESVPYNGRTSSPPLRTAQLPNPSETMVSVSSRITAPEIALPAWINDTEAVPAKGTVPTLKQNANPLSFSL